MAITLKSLCKYAKEDYGMKLICGEETTNNLVNWVHMLEDQETANFLHGQELIITTGIGYNHTEWFVNFVKDLVEHQASGLVLNIGPYIKSVPEELRLYCEEIKFPLYTIPWKTRIVDITNDFCHKIMKAEENEVTAAGAFRNAIFYPKKISEYRPALESKEYDLEAEFCIVALSLQVPSNNDLLDYEKNIRLHLTKILFNYSGRFNIFRQDKYLIVVLQSFPKTVVKSALERLNEVCNYGGKGYQMRAGISVNDYGVASLPRNYKRAIAVLKIAEKQGEDRMFYENIGLYQLLIEVEDTKILERLYIDTLGKLEDYDEKNQTDYFDILKCYLDNNNSVEKVAKATYVHRNTINYKIRKIKEILQCNLDYQEGLRLTLAFHIKEFLY